MQRAWQDCCAFTWRVAVAQAVKRFGQALDDHDAERRSLISKFKRQISLIRCDAIACPAEKVLQKATKAAKGIFILS